MKSKYFLMWILPLFLIVGTLTNAYAQPATKLRNIEPAPGPGYTIYTDANGKQYYITSANGAVNVNNTPIAYVPAASGNPSNNNQVVIDPNGDIWIIDSSGDAVKVSAVITGAETKVTSGTGITITGSGTIASPYIINTTITQADGSETKVTSGSNVTVSGTGTVASPYVISSTGGSAGDGSETKVTAGTAVTVSGTGTIASPYVISSVAGGDGVDSIEYVQDTISLTPVRGDEFVNSTKDTSGVYSSDRWLLRYADPIAAQVVESDNTLLGDGTTGNELKVDTTIIASSFALKDTASNIRSTISAVASARPAGSGTTNTLPLWTSTNILGNSWLSQASNAVSIASGNLIRFVGHTTASRPTGLAGHIGFNTTLGVFEGYHSSAYRGIVATSLSAGKFTNTYVPFVDANGFLTESSNLTYTTGRLVINTGTNNFISGGNATLTGIENTAMGNTAFSAVTTGSSNVAIGHRAMNSANTASSNVAVGHRAADFITSGANNVAVGINSLRGVTTGGQNVGIGTNSLLSIAGNSSNTAVGFGALQNNTTSNNSALGWQALTLNTTGLRNTGLGYRVLATVTTGSSNTGIGYNALQFCTGAGNSAVGTEALAKNTTGGSNAANGWQALLNNTTGSNNIAGGANSVQNNRTGSENIGFGASTLQDFVTKNGNTAVGYNSGSSLSYTSHLIESVDHTTERIIVTAPHGYSANVFLKLSITSGTPTAPGGANFSLIYEFTVVNDTTLQFTNILISSNGSGAMELRDVDELEYTTMLGYNSQVYKNNMVSIGAHTGTGAITNVRMRNYNLNVDQDTIGRDGQVLTLNSSSGEIELQAPMQQNDEVQSIGATATYVVQKNAFLLIDMISSSQTLTLDPTDLPYGSTVTIFVASTSNTFTLDSDVGNFISTSASTATKSITDSSVWQCKFYVNNWYIYQIE